MALRVDVSGRSGQEVCSGDGAARAGPIGARHHRAETLAMISYRIRSFAAASTLAVAVPALLHAQQSGSGPALRSAAQSPTSRRVWSDPASEDSRDGSSVSPDGRFYAFSSAKEGSALAVRTLATGETRYLTGRLSQDKAIDGNAYTPMFSPDGKVIAYSWDSDTIPGYWLRVVDMAGGSSRALYRPVGGGDPVPTGWSPDGRYVVATESTGDRTVHLLLIPVDGGPPRVIKSFLDWQRPSRAKMSPD